MNSLTFRWFVCAGCGWALVAQAAWLEVLPSDAAPGEVVFIQGMTDAGPLPVRVFWEQGGLMRPLIEGEAGLDGSFGFEVALPATVQRGLLRLAARFGSGGPEFASTEINVLSHPPSVLRGRLRDAPAGVGVELLTREGNVVARAVTDASGSFVFGDLPPGEYTVRPQDDEHPPTKADVAFGTAPNVEVSPVDISKWPPVFLTGLGAIALPGGSLPGGSPVQVGEWGNVPFARLISLPGKGRPPLMVRVWASVQKTVNGPKDEVGVFFHIRKGSKTVLLLPATRAVVHPQSPFNFEAWQADFNAMELPNGPLTLDVAAFVSAPIFPEVVAKWSFPLDVADFGSRWLGGNAKNVQLTVKRQDSHRLRYAFSGTLPNLPGVGTPLFSQDLDLRFITLPNRFDLGIALQERFTTDGAWWGQAKATTDLTLLGIPVFGKTLTYAGPSGPSPVKSGYQLSPPLEWPLPAGVHVPVWGAGLPTPINICGFKFDGSVGIFLDVGGSVSLFSSIHPDLRPDATVMPAVNLSLPTGANIEAGPCKATAQIKPGVSVGAPIVLDPWESPPVYWDGLCIQLSGKATVALSCCGIGFDKSFNLFDPIKVGNCPAAALQAKGAEPLPFAPPLNASLAFSPSGLAAAVWENRFLVDGEWRPGPPLISFRRDGVWSEPQPVASEQFPGWEPQVAWVNDRQVVICWVCIHEPGAGGGGRAPAAQRAVSPKGICDTVSTVIGAGCGVLGGFVDLATSVWDSIFGFQAASTGGGGQAPMFMPASPPVFLTEDAWFDGRPVLASDPNTGQAMLVWLREQDPVSPTQRPLALYYSSFTPDGWAAPQRLDPNASTLDIQPTVRFDRAGRPAVVWVRDDDGDLSSGADRRLVMSSRGRLGFWSSPADIPGMPAGAWTPSLDFDNGNNPVVAFVAPPVREDGLLLPAAGMLSEVHVARRRGGVWTSERVADGLTGELPVVRVDSANRAMVVFRGFGAPGRPAASGRIMAATTDLSGDAPRWSAGAVGNGELMEANPVAEFNPETGEPLFLWEERDRAEPEALPRMLEHAAPWMHDLAIAPEGFTVSNPHPNPGELVGLTLTIVNQGLAAIGSETFEVRLYDREPTRGVQPFSVLVASGPLGFGEQTTLTARYLPADRNIRGLVAVVDAGGVIAESDESNNRADLVIGGLPPVTDLAASAPAGGGRIELEWENPLADGTVRHWIWRARSAEEPFELVGATMETQFTDDWALETGDYVYLITAEDASGAPSEAALSSPVQLPDPPAPDPGSLELAITRHDDRITLTWNDARQPRLETTGALAGPNTRWVSVSDGIFHIGGTASVTLPLSAQNAFYRLALP